MCILKTNVCMIRMSVIFFSRHAFCNTFSTHDLSWRSTLIEDTQKDIEDFFNSRPLVEVDPLSGAIYSTIYFSTHDLSWRSTTMYKSMDLENIFQLTTSRGGRQSGNLDIADNTIFSTHDLSWRSTGSRNQVEAVKLFQLTTSRGGRRGQRHHLPMYKLFSTHDLSWRSTDGLTIEAINGGFSTHDLSWRSTYDGHCHICVFAFQLTTSRGGRRKRIKREVRR